MPYSGPPASVSAADAMASARKASRIRLRVVDLVMAVPAEWYRSGHPRAKIYRLLRAHAASRSVAEEAFAGVAGV